MLQGHKNSGATSVLNWLRPLLITVQYLVISVAPSPKGELFATGSGDMRARIWKYVISASSPYMVTAYLWRITTDMELIGEPRHLSSKDLGLEEMDRLYLQNSYNPFLTRFQGRRPLLDTTNKDQIPDIFGDAKPSPVDSRLSQKYTSSGFGDVSYGFC